MQENYMTPSSPSRANDSKQSGKRKRGEKLVSKCPTRQEQVAHLTLQNVMEPTGKRQIRCNKSSLGQSEHGELLSSEFETEKSLKRTRNGMYNGATTRHPGDIIAEETELANPPSSRDENIFEETTLHLGLAKESTKNLPASDDGTGRLKQIIRVRRRGKTSSIWQQSILETIASLSGNHPASPVVKAVDSLCQSEDGGVDLADEMARTEIESNQHAVQTHPSDLDYPKKDISLNCYSNSRPTREASARALENIYSQEAVADFLDKELLRGSNNEDMHSISTVVTNGTSPGWLTQAATLSVKIKYDGRIQKVLVNNSLQTSSKNEGVCLSDHSKEAKIERADSRKIDAAVDKDFLKSQINNKCNATEAAHWTTLKTSAELAAKDDIDPNAAYIEDIAWRKYAIKKHQVLNHLHKLPPPIELPDLSIVSDEQSCSWSFDETTRILRVTLKPGISALSPKAKTFLCMMMERDDIAVITAGLCQGLDSSLWNQNCITRTSGEMYHHRFRRFRRIEPKHDVTGGVGSYHPYEEIQMDVSMRVSDYFDYLTSRQDIKSRASLTNPTNREFPCTCRDGSLAKVDVADVVYMLDYDIKKKLPLHYENFKDTFLFPEILPGGKMCAMNAVNEAARPDMGPNLYITPPGSFTRFHLDGYGTVDSGHLCLSGYNEVVIIRRLPKGHDRLAIQSDRNCFGEMPHSDMLENVIGDWPTKNDIKRMKESNYCPIVLILGPGEHLHIGKGRFHAFRKLCAQTLPDEDCHSDLRKEVHAKLKQENLDLQKHVFYSLAWDWSFLGVTPEGINREMTATLEFALFNRNPLKPKQSLAIPKLCLLSRCKSAVAALQSDETTFGINTLAKAGTREHNLGMIKGLLPALEFVVWQEYNALQSFKTVTRHEDDIVQSSEKPHSWENPVIFPLDPYGNADYYCKICFQELSNTYLHCDGCEELLQKDFNICSGCHSESRQCQFYVMNDKNISVDSSLNHTGSFPSELANCGHCLAIDECWKCHKCRKCSCKCHRVFSIQQRLWNLHDLIETLDAARLIVGHDKVRFHDEVIPRLTEALRSQSMESPRHLSVQPSVTIKPSPEELAFTQPFASDEILKALGGSRFDLEHVDLSDLKTFLAKARASGNPDDLDGVDREAAHQLYQNFKDFDISVSSRKNRWPLFSFSRQERDILAYAILRCTQELESSPTTGNVGKNKTIEQRWVKGAWNLMRYRGLQAVNLKFRSWQKYEKSFSHDYRSYLISKISCLFATKGASERSDS